MYDNPILALVAHRGGQPETSLRPAEASHRHSSLATLRAIVETWRERRRFRCDLEQMSKDNPYLIDDIGLTGRQVRAEIAKRFWQV